MKNNSLIGRTLANFQIKRLLGRGGMADVYFGLDIKLHRPVAIKVFEVENRSQMNQANRFIQEARMMANWRHENIVPIYYAGDETGLYYYVMEYIDGYDLASIMSVYAEKGELMPSADVLRIGNSIAKALDYAHAKGVIHRDVKPANVMIANDGRVVLGDFGLALDLNALTQGEVFGSPHYISPEQARRSSDAVPQSDLYSLGVILYEMLTGATPFNDPSPASLALQHITEQPPSPRSFNPGLSVNVENVLLKALDKNPKDRYQTGKSLMQALDEALAAKPAAIPADVPPLPPIPVNAPTIQRSNISLNSFTKRRDVITALERRTTTRINLEDEVNSNRRTAKGMVWGLFSVILLAALFFGWMFRPELYSPLSKLFNSRNPSPVAAPITEIAAMNIPATNTSLPEPTVTQTEVLPTSTTIPTVTVTTTQTKSPTQTFTPTASPTVAPATSSATPAQLVVTDGYPMTAYYNESSFYILNQGRASRSVSGFVFERVNDDGTFQDRFEGWNWEQARFNAIAMNRCVSLEIDKAETPYLSPVECDNRTTSTLAPAIDSNILFWTTIEAGNQFRILWLNQEIARCQIEAGICEFLVP